MPRLRSIRPAILAAIFTLGCRISTAQKPSLPEIGGRQPIMLERSLRVGADPQFLSVTTLPGRGLNIFRIVAHIPGRGDVEVLKSPSLAEAASALNGTGDDAFGNMNHSFGAAFLIPFSSRVGGTVSPDGKSITAQWMGQPIVLPNDFLGKYAVHGLLNQAKADDVKIVKTADGEVLTAVIHAGDFDGHWLSRTDLRFTLALSGPAVEVTVTATNVGKIAEPMAIGWHPYLAIPSGQRSQARVHIPAAAMARLDRKDGLTTGDLDPVAGTAMDFSMKEGRLLDASMNNNFSHLSREAGIVNAWLADPAASYGIRVEGLSPRINTVHLYSPHNGDFAAIEEQFNFQDPFGAEWNGMDTGMVTLQPGESTTWEVRLVLFTP